MKKPTQKTKELILPSIESISKILNFSNTFNFIKLSNPDLPKEIRWYSKN
jgi:hypothetical protein|tara:strand:+ start:12642 stop:12791 length:150 start_codon:yes stop_codon:yes gene_type:complete